MRGMRLGAAALVAVLLGAATARAADKEAIDAAVERGVRYVKALQTDNGILAQQEQIGLTALCGLTLLECGVPADDPFVQRAADAVRGAAVGLTHTYSLALGILFLDRLREPVDVALIESLAVRLLGGQNSDGTWSYACPEISTSEQRRLTTLVEQRTRVGRAKEPAPAEGGRRVVQDLPKEVQAQLDQVLKQRAAQGGVTYGRGDHSNTQFAVLGLWTARRHGLPVDAALGATEQHFRQQQHPNGGWAYQAMIPGEGLAALIDETPAMTCAGLLAVGAAYAAWNEEAEGHDPRGKDAPRPDQPQDASKDRTVLAAYRLIGAWLDALAADQRGGRAPVIHLGGSGKFYYFLWSLERAAVAFGVDRFGRTDWYDWGANILLANQGPDGGWVNGEYRTGADTCFALLFLKRANLAKDLSRSITTHMKEGMQSALRQGGLGGADLIKRKPFFNGPAAEGGRDAAGGEADSEASRLTRQLTTATGVKQDQYLKALRDTKGVAFTQALAAIIPSLEGDAQKKAREALAERLSRMNSETLAVKLEDDDAEVRRAAALAVAMKEDKAHTYKLIELLSDPEATVERAAHAALKSLSDQDFGPAKDASRQERARAIEKWKAWWGKQSQGKR